ncbi:MAG: hypothetical protein H0X25_21640 [Acidobacteriales bacterium]|nr:hypothetical protein [Terriglobales bacterium]
MYTSTAGRNFTFSGQLTAAAKSLTFSRLARFAMILILGTCAAAQTLATIHDFGAGRDGENPQSGVIFDRKGNLYGSAALGGATGNGSIYSLTPPAGGQGPWTESILHQFTGKPDGQTPDSVLTMTQTGNLFGTTQLGGAKNLGSVFAVIPPAAPGGSWSERVLYSFGTVPKDGSGPNMGLLAVTGGLIGVTVDAAARCFS